MRIVLHFLLMPAAIMGFALWSLSAAADQTWSVRQAHEQLAAGEIILLDIRSPSEWRETGVAEGAWPITMHSRQFGEQLSRIVSGFPDKTIGLICAVGGRSGYVWELLNSRGLKNFVDIPEGMMGSEAGPGWLKTGLPTVPVEEAMSAVPKGIAE